MNAYAKVIVPGAFGLLAAGMLFMFDQDDAAVTVLLSTGGLLGIAYSVPNRS